MNTIKSDLTDRSLISNGRCLPYNPKLNQRARDMRLKMTKAEAKIWFGFLAKSKYKFYRQKIIDNYIVDFYCAELKLVIEIDGEIHDNKENIIYDKMRTELLEKYELNVLRIRNNDVFNDFDGVCEGIRGKITHGE